MAKKLKSDVEVGAWVRVTELDETKPYRFRDRVIKKVKVGVVEKIEELVDGSNLIYTVKFFVDGKPVMVMLYRHEFEPL